MRFSTRPRERGAALLLAMIAITALLSLGALTVLTVQAEHQSGGQGRFEQQALYVAESGAYGSLLSFFKKGQRYQFLRRR